MSKLDVEHKISYEDEQNGQLWLSHYNSSIGEDGQVGHSFKWTKEKKDAKSYRYNRAKQIALYFLDALLDADKSSDSFRLMVVSPSIHELVEE